MALDQLFKNIDSSSKVGVGAKEDLCSQRSFQDYRCSQTSHTFWVITCHMLN
jgi:hypothetical protein